MFNIHQRINSLKQNGIYVSDYFNKLDGLWKEFDGSTSLTKCTCEAAIKLNDHAKLIKLMQFLSGLYESYNQVKSAFSIISREESLQRNGSLYNDSHSVSKSQPSAFIVSSIIGSLLVILEIKTRVGLFSVRTVV